MLIKFDIGSDLFNRIQELIKEGKYGDIYQFIKIALDNQMQEERATLGEKPVEITHDSIIEKTPMELGQQKSESSWEKLDNKLKEIIIDEVGLSPKKHEVIWSFYNRFLPVKIAIFKLAELISYEKPWIEIGDLQEAALEFAQQISEQLKNYEDENGLRRYEKLSTGLPLSKADLRGIRKKSEQRKILAKIESGKKRFTNQFVGRYVKNEQTFKGAGFVMGLMEVRLSGETYLVTLSELGKQFALLENPVINKKYEQSLSEAEVQLIYKNIYPKFPTEKKLVDLIIDKLQKKKKLEAKEIDGIFDNYKQKILEYYSKDPHKLPNDKINKIMDQCRGATMGRLSELRIVKWEINKRGLSEYTLNSEKLNLLN